MIIDNEKARRVLEALEKKKLTLGSVESLTGGLFASTLTSVPGASKVFKGSLVTYWSEEKIALADVSATSIRDYGVVSQKVANEMAKGGRKRLNVDVCVSFTGNAGPTSEPGSAPVGRVNMAIATPWGRLQMQQDFTLTRNEIREASVDMMLDQLIAIFED